MPNFLPGRKPLGAALALALALLAAACGPPPPSLLGRWERQSEPDVEDPLGTLAAQYLEFRPDGLLVALLADDVDFFTLYTGTYALLEDDRIAVTGRCWQGDEIYQCTGEYQLRLDGDRLRLISEAEGRGQVEYRRFGPVGSAPPPTLAPPRPSPAGG